MSKAIKLPTGLKTKQSRDGKRAGKKANSSGQGSRTTAREDPPSLSFGVASCSPHHQIAFFTVALMFSVEH